jgi:hypothetical protein
MVDKAFSIIALLSLAIIAGIIGYNEIATKNVKVVIDLEKDYDVFTVSKKIIPNDCNIIEIKEIDKFNNQYEITISTKAKKTNLLEWIINSHQVKKAEIIKIIPKY